MRAFSFVSEAIRLVAAPVPLRTHARLAACSTFAISLLWSGCSDEGAYGGGWIDSASAFVVDDNHDTLSTAIARERVVSLVPSITETIVAMGGTGRLVARTRFDQDPHVSSLPSVGGMVDPGIEAILMLQPDLIVTSDEADLRSLPKRFRGLGIPTYVAETRSISDFRRHTHALGALFGMTEEADSLVRWVDRELASVRPAVPLDPLPSVLFVVWPDPLITTGQGTFVDELIRIAGGRGTFDDLATPWPTVSFEPVIAREPQVILLATSHGIDLNPSQVLTSPRWMGLPAVRNGNIHQVDADLFTRAGPRMVEAARSLAQFIRASGAGP